MHVLSSLKTLRKYSKVLSNQSIIIQSNNEGNDQETESLSYSLALTMRSELP